MLAPTVAIKEFTDRLVSSGRDLAAVRFLCVPCSRFLKELVQVDEFTVRDSDPLQNDWESNVLAEYNKNLPELN